VKGQSRALRSTGLQRTQKQIVGVRAGPADLEYLHHVEELAVNITNHCNRRADVHHVALLHQKLLRLCTYCFYHGLGQQLLLREPRYALVEVDSS
jgi:hypothetical protein